MAYQFGCAVVPFMEMAGFLLIPVLIHLLMGLCGRLRIMRVGTQTRYGKSWDISVMLLHGTTPFMYTNQTLGIAHRLLGMFMHLKILLIRRSMST
jgi:hypothetical protein